MTCFYNRMIERYSECDGKIRCYCEDETRKETTDMTILVDKPSFGEYSKDFAKTVIGPSFPSTRWLARQSLSSRIQVFRLRGANDGEIKQLIKLWDEWKGPWQVDTKHIKKGA